MGCRFPRSNYGEPSAGFYIYLSKVCLPSGVRTYRTEAAAVYITADTKGLCGAIDGYPIKLPVRSTAEPPRASIYPRCEMLRIGSLGVGSLVLRCFYAFPGFLFSFFF